MSETEPPRLPVAIWLALAVSIGGAPVVATIVWQGELAEADRAISAARARPASPAAGPGLFVGRAKARRALKQTPLGKKVAGYDAWATVGKSTQAGCEQFELKEVDLDIGSAKLDMDGLYADNVKSLTLTPSLGALCLHLPVDSPELPPEATKRECGSGYVHYSEVVLEEGQTIAVSACREGSALVRCDHDRGADFLTASTRDVMLGVWADGALTSVRLLVAFFGAALLVIGLLSTRYAPRASRGRGAS